MNAINTAQCGVIHTPVEVIVPNHYKQFENYGDASEFVDELREVFGIDTVECHWQPSYENWLVTWYA